MNNEDLKTTAYKKNRKLDALLARLNDSLEQVQDHGLPLEKRHPILFVVGTPRSGTTLLTQWLAALGLFCYPSNLISRFYKAPYIGALVQEMLVNPEYSYKKEFDLSTSISFNSDVGKTAGILEPHEFWYYWRLFFNFPDIPTGNAEFLEKADFRGFQRGIHEIQQLYDKPFFMKALIMNWYIEPFSEHIYHPIFLYIKRDPISNMGSLLETREKYLGTKDLWFSFKPREFESLRTQNRFIQVAGQVFFTNRAIENSLKGIPARQQMQVQYEDFCNAPAETFAALKAKLAENGYVSQAKASGPEKFQIPVGKDKGEIGELVKAYSFVQESVG